MSDFPYKEIEQKLNYTFSDKTLLKNAFVHSSYANEEGIADNERMEFFGDAVLENIASEYLYLNFPDKDAGELSKARASVVSAAGLKKAVDELKIMQYLLVSGGAFQVKKLSKKIEANLFEAVLCAVYLDGGYRPAKEFALLALSKYLDGAEITADTDYKTLLQEYCQQNKLALEYKMTGRSGPDNKPIFTYALYVEGKYVSEGSGTTIKNAEAAAAKIIVEKWGISK